MISRRPSPRASRKSTDDGFATPTWEVTAGASQVTTDALEGSRSPSRLRLRPAGSTVLAPDLGVPMIMSVDNAILKPAKWCDPRYIVYALSTPMNAMKLDTISAPVMAAVPLARHVEALRALTPGWYDETSPAYAPEALDWLATQIRELLDAFGLPAPFLYPTPEGLARAEWSAPRWEVVANIDLGARVAEVIAARADGDEARELTVAFDELGDESVLGRFLVDHIFTHS
ncbi:MAG: hypothetical protein QM820_54125 [Minicystis sp.]